MKPSEQNLERLLKKLIKQESVTASELLFNWQGLGKSGDRTVIRTLNKQNGWEFFGLWSESEPEIRNKLAEISEQAGISEAGLLVLQAAGLVTRGTASPRSESLWVLQSVRQGSSQDWDRAAELMTQNEDFFEGTLSLLELEESTQTVLFLTQLLKRNLSREPDQAIRKALYRLRQKGMAAPHQERVITGVEASRPEIFLFAENRLPLWQPFFYYRSTGARGDWFFAEINEAKIFEIIQQQRDIRMNQKTMQRMADNYAREFRKGTGVDMSFVSIGPSHARYFIEKSFELLRGSEDFKKYMGEGPIEDPTLEWNVRAGLVAADAALLLNHDYFKLWIAEEAFLDGILNQFRQIEEGPIILPEQQRREQKRGAMDQALQEYFSGDKGRAWILALKKAAYFLQSSDPEMAALSLGFSRQLSNPETIIEANPFGIALVERSLEIRNEQNARQQKEEKRSSLIMTPQEFERTLNTETQRHRDKK